MKTNILITRLSLCSLVLVSIAGGAGEPPPGPAQTTVRFDDLPAGGPPATWRATQTGTGTARWEIRPEPTAPSAPNVLAVSGPATYPLCLKPNAHLEDGFVEVKLRAIGGKEDQAGGVVWRARDADNYYVCRANALEENVVLYKTVAGKRTALDIVGRQGGYGVKTPVPPQKWHTLRVEFTGTRFQVVWNGQPLFAVVDGTFADAGMVGVWSKADSETLFDDFVYGAGK